MKELILAHILEFLTRFYYSTMKYEIIFEDENDRKFFYQDLYNYKLNPESAGIYAFFHQDEFSLVPHFAHKGLAVMVSKSKDGQLMSNYANLLGYKTIRGSSSKGAVAALLKAIQIVRAGHKFSVAVDGPRGPIYEVKEGIIRIQEKSGHPIIPMRAQVNRAYVLHRAWNKGRVPKMFAHIKIHIGKIGKYTREGLELKLKSLPSHA
jgi:lysophospholipid acyltransferase (LPLAT)-like uncharacterized protein